MDGRLGIEDNRQALLRIVAALLAMIGPPTLPRHLHRAALKILRPAEWAARRLVIAFAHGIKPPPPRPRAPRQPAGASILVRHGYGTGIVIPWAARQALRAANRQAGKTPRRLALPLFDPMPRRTRLVGSKVCAPRIGVASAGQKLFPVKPRLPLGPRDPLDAARLGLRIAALSAALNDLPRQALRYARWRDASRIFVRAPGKRRRRVSPIRNWGLPGKRTAPEAHGLLREAHSRAVWALGDTS